MKIINEKGKLFGLINIIDLSVLLIAVLLAAAVGYKAMGPKINQGSVQTKEATFIVKLSVKPQTLADSLAPGDRIVSEIGRASCRERV